MEAGAGLEFEASSEILCPQEDKGRGQGEALVREALDTQL